VTSMMNIVEDLRQTNVGQEVDPGQCVVVAFVAGLVTYALISTARVAQVLDLIALAVAAGVLVMLLAAAFAKGTARWFLTGVGSGVIVVSGLMLWSATW
jgi:hypothetical protein